MGDRQFGSDYPPSSSSGLRAFDIEVHDGIKYLSLDDKFYYEVGAKSLEQTQQQRRRKTASSAMYDGEWEIHSTLANVTERIEVYVFGQDQVTVTDGIARLIDAFSQPLYNVRVSMDQDVQVWRCFPAEYSVNRGQVNAHARRATMTFTVPRFPKISYEVRQ